MVRNPNLGGVWMVYFTFIFENQAIEILLQQIRSNLRIRFFKVDIYMMVYRHNDAYIYTHRLGVGEIRTNFAIIVNWVRTNKFI